MTFWTLPIRDLLLLMALLAVGGVLRRVVPALASLGVPASMVAGLVMLALGPSGAAVLPFDVATFETLVYHGLGLVFATVALMPRPAGRMPAGARSIALAIPMLAACQGILALGVTLLVGAAQGAIHPGYGLLVPLGFSQGPGQALSIGRAWEASGLTDGGQVGLAVAALGFLWCALVGVPLVAVGKRMGWDEAGPRVDLRQVAPITAVRHPQPGQLDPLAWHAAVVGSVYLVSFAVLQQVAGLLEGNDQAQAMVWGFHFLIAFFIGAGVRLVIDRLDPGMVNGDVMRRLTGLTVDVTTASAFAAVELAVVATVLPILLLVTSAGGLVTVAGCVLLARRVFPIDPWGHAVALFGLSTGTLPTGLALLRVHDPELTSQAARNLVLGAATAIVPGIPLLLFVLPMGVVGWPDSHPWQTLQTMGALAVYVAALAGVWRVWVPTTPAT